ncbi:NAD(P)/FAD-dependent oxidoreductase [Acetobacteraceae bacterium KSS8]|uniref:NAD(P)/FAD-dependent oxidoreductase n=1 Tax=Endosaccharibacter trunci TaxID=2812733 RepID=A0ABT1W8X7_9PROT|nr:NAD(P)/FAD-dependent oxidoreductase [Acetobacteraceae bacterium KSS8]
MNALPATEETEVLVVGSGFSGLIMALSLKRRRIPFLVLEKADGVGGTWRDNTYPGCACDIPSHLYSISSEPNPNWQRTFAPQPEILRYLQGVAAKRGLMPSVRFGAELTGAQWSESDNKWTVRTTDGRRFRGRVLVLAVGALHIPLLPRIPGLDAFEGRTFHSARWDHGYDLAGKEVAVIGTGASAIQFVPQIADKVQHLTVFQRTPPWVLPKGDHAIPTETQTRYGTIPGLRSLHRLRLFGLHEMRHMAMRRHPKAAALGRSLADRHRKRAIKDEALRAALTPRYEIGCKRILQSDDYYPALARDNVRLETTPIARIASDGVVTADGVLHRADAILFGTGFHVTDGFDAMDIRGRDNRSLRETWRGGMSAAYGTAVTGFPNMFVLLGPNTGLGHNSVVLMIEAQVRYVMRRLRQMRMRRLRSIEMSATVQERYQREMDRRLADTVWQAGGCSSWYQDESGRNTTLWPGTVFEYQRRMSRAGLRDYIIKEAV